MSLWIKNGKVVTEEGVIEQAVCIEGEVIREIGAFNPLPEDEVIDAQGDYVMPGGIDPHTHMELQQSEQYRSADDFYTGTKAAALGGTTSIIDHIGFAPAGSSLHYSLELYREKAKKAVIDYSFHGVIQQVDENILKELKGLIEDEGIASFKAYSTYGFKVEDEGLLKLLRTMKEAGGILTVHCENDAVTNLLKSEFIEQGKTDAIWHAKSRPARAESEFIGRLCELSALAGNAPIYIVHTSTELGARRIASFRAEGVPAAMETCPQYLLLNEDKYTEGGNGEGIKYIMAPPLRPESDRKAMWKALADGTCQTIGTDHCPFLYREKEAGLDNFSKAPGGAPGIEERIPLLFTMGVLEGRLSPEQFAALTSTNAAKLLGMYPRKGTIRIGSDADLVILGEGPEQIISAKNQASVCDYSIYEGMKHRTRIEAVLSRGEVIVRKGEFLGARGRGRFMPRFLAKKEDGTNI